MRAYISELLTKYEMFSEVQVATKEYSNICELNSSGAIDPRSNYFMASTTEYSGDNYSLKS